LIDQNDTVPRITFASRCNCKGILWFW